jgi:hypothetical protein
MKDIAAEITGSLVEAMLTAGGSKNDEQIYKIQKPNKWERP